MELLQSEAGIRLRYVPYSKTPPALAAMGDEVPLAFDFAASSSAQVQARKLRVLLVTGATRMASLPDTPTVKELGFGGMIAPLGF